MYVIKIARELLVYCFVPNIKHARLYCCKRVDAVGQYIYVCMCTSQYASY